MTARVVFLVGSVFSLFGIWKLLSPLVYKSIVAEPRQGIAYMILGIVLLLAGWFFEKKRTWKSE